MKEKDAHWIRYEHLFRDDDYKCSACGCKTAKPEPFCPRCKTEMKGVKSDPVWVEEMADYDEIFGDDDR
jgi:predicted amidophosphoribosyltransferase